MRMWIFLSLIFLSIPDSQFGFPSDPLPAAKQCCGCSDQGRLVNTPVHQIRGLTPPARQTDNVLPELKAVSAPPVNIRPGHSQGDRFFQVEEDLGGRRSRGTAQQVAASPCVAARQEPRPPMVNFAQIEQTDRPGLTPIVKVGSPRPSTGRRFASTPATCRCSPDRSRGSFR